MSTSITVELLVDVPQDAVDIVTFAISYLLEQHCGEGEEVKVVFCGLIIDPQREWNRPVAGTSLDGKTITFAMDGIAACGWTSNFGMPTALLLLAGYEAMRAVHVRKGDAPPPSYTLSPHEHATEPHHVAAWQESLSLFKAVCPELALELVFPQVGARYATPAVSHYVLDRSLVPSVFGREGDSPSQRVPAGSSCPSPARGQGTLALE